MCHHSTTVFGTTHCQRHFRSTAYIHLGSNPPHRAGLGWDGCTSVPAPVIFSIVYLAPTSPTPLGHAQASPPPPAFRYPIAYPTTAGGTPPLAPTSPTPLGHAQASTPPPTFPYPNICSTYSTIPSISSSLGNSPIQCLNIGGSLGGVSSKRPFDRQSPGEFVRVEI